MSERIKIENEHHRLSGLRSTDMSREVERFVGLLVSDDDFVKEVTRDFDAAVRSREIRLDETERAILRESLNSYVKPQIMAPGGAIMIIPAVVGAAVAASVAGNVATKVVDKLFSHFATPFNMHIRDSLLHRGIVKESDLPR